jgi:hypothetical protein
MVFDWRRILRFALLVPTLVGCRFAMRWLADAVPAEFVIWLARLLGAETASHVIVTILVAMMVAGVLTVYWLTSKALSIPMRTPSSKTSSLPG